MPADPEAGNPKIVNNETRDRIFYISQGARIFVLLVEGSVFCICFEGNGNYEKFKERTMFPPLWRAIGYFAIPLVLMAMSWYPWQLLNVFIYWIAAALYLWIWRKSD